MESLKIGVEFDKDTMKQLDLLISKIKELNNELDKLNQRQVYIPYRVYPNYPPYSPTSPYPWNPTYYSTNINTEQK